MKEELVDNLDTDPEDLEDALKTIEKSFRIQFASNELSHIQTIGELTDHIISKISLQDKDDCTNQQGFYKLREAIVTTKNIEKKSIQVETNLISIFRKPTRLDDFRKIEQLLGFKLNALRPKHATSITALALFIISIILLFINWRCGLIGIVLSIILFWVFDRLGKEFKDKTIGELTERMTQRNYLQSRRDKGAVNKNEIATKIEGLLIDELKLDRNEIRRETIVVQR